MPSRHFQSLFRKWNSGSGCEGGFSGSGPQDALRPARWSRRIEHRRAQPLVGDRRLGKRRDGLGVVGVARVAEVAHVRAAVDDEAAAYARATRERRCATGSFASDVTSTCASQLSTT
jgi:hypothetical protein